MAAFHPLLPLEPIAVLAKRCELGCRVKGTTMTAPQLLFYDWPYSPFCMKVRAILEYKKVEYKRVNPLGRTMVAIRRRGRIGKVPAIEFDGEMVIDSTDIAYELERRFPQRPIVPEGERERALCHALEDWADESLYFIGLYYRWHEQRGRRPVSAAFGKKLTGKLAYRFYLRRILNQIKGQGTLRKPPEHVMRDLSRHLDAVETLVDPGPYLLGDAPYLCDFALWGQLNYLRRTPVGGHAMARRRPIEQYMARMAQPDSTGL
jgi:glutathione S-transferase